MLVQLDDPATVTASVFSAREQEVLAGIRRGLRNKEIATRLGMTDEGVRYHLRNIYRKTGVSKREAAVRYARSLGPSVLTRSALAAHRCCLWPTGRRGCRSTE